MKSRPLQQADKAPVMLHGRGADTRDILGLVSDLNIEEYAILSPQATPILPGPYSFMEKPEQNEFPRF